MVLTEAYVAQHIKVQPGVYVLLAISDTGSGLDDDMQLHLFEPFYAQARGRRAVSALGGARHRPAERRAHLGVQRGRPRDDLQDLSARGTLSRAIERWRAVVKRCRTGGRRCCSSRTSRVCARSRRRCSKGGLHRGDREQR